jgi:hypothetical protein
MTERIIPYRHEMMYVRVYDRRRTDAWTIPLRYAYSYGLVNEIPFYFSLN